MTITQLESTITSTSNVGGLAQWMNGQCRSVNADLSDSPDTNEEEEEYVRPLPITVHGHYGMTEVKEYLGNIIREDIGEYYRNIGVRYRSTVMNKDHFNSLCMSLTESARDEATLCDVISIARHVAR